MKRKFALLFITVLTFINVTNLKAQNNWNLIAELELPYYMGWSDLQINNNLMYVIGGGNDGYINIYNVEDMSNPVQVFSQTYSGYEFGHMLIEGNTLFIIGSNGLFIFDLTNPGSPTFLVHHAQINEFSIGDYNNIIRKSGNLLFVNSSLWRFMVLDISNVYAPVYYDSFEFNWNTVEDFYVLTSTLGILDDGSGLRYVDFSNPSDLQVTLSDDASYIDFSCGSEGMTITSNLMTVYMGTWCTDGNYIHTINLSSNSVTSTFDYNTIDVGGDIGDISIHEEKNLLIAGNVVSFHMFDISNPNDLQYIGAFTEGGYNPVKFIGDYIFANGSGDVKIYGEVTAVTPDADFTADATNITEGTTVNFTDLSTNEPTSWSWNFGDGGSSTEQNPSHEYTAVGVYTVALTASNAAGSNTETKYSYITVVAGGGDAPEAIFSATPLELEVGGTVVFSDLSLNSPTSWSWDFGDGGTSTDQSPSHVYNTAGIYTVSLTVTNVDGSDTETKENYITVNDNNSLPNANFEASSTLILVGGTVSFTDLTTNDPLSWYWEFGDGGTSNEQNPTYTYNTEGVYSVKLIATNINGSDTEIKENYITVTSSGLPPDCDFEYSANAIAVGQSVLFEDKSKNDPSSWLWDFGDGNTSTEQNPYHIYFTEGVYTVSLIVINEYGSDTLTRNDLITVSASGYCESTTDGQFEYISGVELGDISNTGTNRAQNGYISYISMYTQLNTDEEYEISVTLGNLRPEGIYGVWIDWNQDMDFEDENEFIELPDFEDNTATGTIAPPENALEGSTRLRVRVTNSDFNELEPCGEHEFGETEDYTVYVHVVEVIGVDAVSLQNLEIYPNPSNGEITISNPQSSNGDLRIYSIDGKRVFNSNINAETHNITIDLTSLSKGIYIVKLQSGSNIYREKILIK